MQDNKQYYLSRSLTNSAFNIWDVMVAIIVLGALAALAWGAAQMSSPYQIGDTIEISLSPHKLPEYAIKTVIRMFIALFFSLCFTFTIAPLAAKNKQAEKFLIPFIDIMQSLPILGMLSITIVGFIHFFPNSLLGPECAAIFVLFTSQVWNMTLSLYQSLRTVPKDLQEAATMYRLSAWQKFWRIEVPHGTPGLLWNIMMSMSGGWFYIVYTEAISVANQDITLPGIGSYISKAILVSNLNAIFYAIIAMTIVIFIYDQLLFRPLLSWANKFKAEIDEEEFDNQSWFFDILAKTHLLKNIELIFAKFLDKFINWPGQIIIKYPIKQLLPRKFPTTFNFHVSAATALIWNVILTVSLIAASFCLFTLLRHAIPLSEVGYVFYLGAITAIKVIILIVLASIIWIPIGVWIGLNPKFSSLVQPLIQFLAAFPANLFYPIVVFVILKYNLNQNIWTTPLMILGTQWYILFNVIAGTSTIPKEIRLAAKNFGVHGWLWWKRISLPAIFPYYATGAMAAAGGCWNASITAEFVQWGDHTMISLGLGSYIHQFTSIGDFPRIALGIAVMSLYVLVFNKCVWKKMYALAESKFSIN
jgi:NitT/TauT family transport system permease protein